ncbi:MAG: hypothetical protein ACPG8V_01380 [Alphaproteobacteria bacterium]
MKKLTILSSLFISSTAFAHTNAVHNEAHVSNFHFLTELDHLGLLVLAVAGIGFGVKYAYSKVKSK